MYSNIKLSLPGMHAIAVIRLNLNSLLKYYIDPPLDQKQKFLIDCLQSTSGQPNGVSCAHNYKRECFNFCLASRMWQKCM